MGLQNPYEQRLVTLVLRSRRTRCREWWALTFGPGCRYLIPATCSPERARNGASCGVLTIRCRVVSSAWNRCAPNSGPESPSQGPNPFTTMPFATEALLALFALAGVALALLSWLRPSLRVR